MRKATLWMTVMVASLMSAGVALAGPDQQDVVDHAAATIAAMRTDPSFGNAPKLMRRARAVMVVPELVKGGFFFGGEGGNGVLLAKTANGWTSPAFYTVGAASFGLQIGVETAEVVFLVMSERALNAWMKNEVKLGAQAGLTVAVIGSNAEADATTNANVDVIAWARSKGAYAGLTLEGSLIKPRDSYNEAYYGRKLSAEQIIHGAGANHAADGLRQSLAAR
ncbi:MAG: lipid-binding SYLF domain-containing protein [Pseudomonadota bacterium]